MPPSAPENIKGSLDRGSGKSVAALESNRANCSYSFALTVRAALKKRHKQQGYSHISSKLLCHPVSVSIFVPWGEKSQYTFLSCVKGWSHFSSKLLVRSVFVSIFVPRGNKGQCQFFSYGRLFYTTWTANYLYIACHFKEMNFTRF